MRVIYYAGVSVLLLLAGTAHAQVDLSGAWAQRLSSETNGEGGSDAS